MTDLFSKIVDLFSKLLENSSVNTAFVKSPIWKKSIDWICYSELTDKISKTIDEGKYTIGVFPDLSKAFDTVNHKIL